MPIGEVDPLEGPRCPTGLPGFDRVLGGGLVPGSVVLLGGEPGIGKSTLLFQAGAASRPARGATSCTRAPKSRRRRCACAPSASGSATGGCSSSPRPTSSRIVAEAEARLPALVVVDSVQAVSSPSLASTPGTVSQVRAVAAELTRYAKSRGVPVLLVGHVTKDGNLAGPKSLEHLVDAVVSIEGDRGGSRRLLRATKNRFGPVDEIALYEMTGEGLAELPDASAVLLAERRAGLPGSAVTAAREGTPLGPRRDPGARRRRVGRVAAARRDRRSTAGGWRCCSRCSRGRAWRSRPARSSSRAREESR